LLAGSVDGTAITGASSSGTISSSGDASFAATEGLAGRRGIFGTASGRVYDFVAVESLLISFGVCQVDGPGSLRCTETEMDRTIFLLFIHHRQDFPLVHAQISQCSRMIILIIRISQYPSSFKYTKFKVLFFIFQTRFQPCASYFLDKFPKGTFRRIDLEGDVGVTADCT